MLRQWDDLAKQADWQTPSLAHFLSRAARCAGSAPHGVTWPVVARGAVRARCSTPRGTR